MCTEVGVDGNLMIRIARLDLREREGYCGDHQMEEGEEGE